LTVRSISNGWDVDEDGLARAVDALSIRLPVTVRTRRGTQTIGRYNLGRMGARDDCGRIFHPSLAHVIELSTEIAAETASRCLWHELIHAWQAEEALSPWLAEDAAAAPRCDLQAGVALYEMKKAEGLRGPYRDRPWEVEARVGESFSDDISLTRSIPVAVRRVRRREVPHLSFTSVP
jgi:hypothetical protein